jgi:hypothetical protein
MEEIQNLLQQYGINEQELLEWGKQNYPEFINNIKLIAKLYLQFVKKVSIPKKRSIYGVITPISELEAEVWSNIQGIVAEIVDIRNYSGCPQCLKKIEEGNCPTHNIKPVTLVWQTVEVGDNSGSIICEISPRNPKLEIGYKILARGFLDPEKEAFRVFQLEILEKPKPKEKPKEEKPKEITSLAEILPKEEPKPEEEKPKEEKKEEKKETPPIIKTKPMTPEPLISYVKVSAMMGKTEEETRKYVEKIIKKENLECTFEDILEEAKVTVENGILKLKK